MPGPNALDRVSDPHTAVLSAIALEGGSFDGSKARLELILSLPDRSLRRYTVATDRAAISTTLAALRSRLTTPPLGDAYLPAAQTLYDWLIRPLESDLAASQIQNLVFVLDGALRNVPPAVLHDGDRFLIEKYALSVAPSLHLVDPQPLASPRVLAAGIFDPHDGRPSQPSVARELQAVRETLAGEQLTNEKFTRPALENLLARSDFSILHVASRGQFASVSENTFLSAWDGAIDAKQLAALLGAPDARPTAIELLVFSACQTASGDEEAALGLAGLSVRAGARSTLASLWVVGDVATSAFIERFYQNLADGTRPAKANALRQAQLHLIQDTPYRHPFYWSGFVLMGSWL